VENIQVIAEEELVNRFVIGKNKRFIKPSLNYEAWL